MLWRSVVANSTNLRRKGNDSGLSYLWNITGVNQVGFNGLYYCVQGTLVSLVSVSYTHLDVYKRQAG